MYSKTNSEPINQNIRLNNKIVIVLGMMRSGTSFLSNWLSESKIEFGDNLIPANQLWNEEGFFEETEIRSILEKVKKRSDDFLNRLLIRKIIDVKLENNEKILINQLIKKNLTFKKQWGWKNPFATLIWENHLAEIFKNSVEKNNLIILVSFRDYQSVVESLLRVTRFSRHFLLRLHCQLFPEKYANKYLDMWIKYYKSIINYYENKSIEEKILFLSSKSLIEHSEKIFEKLVTFGLIIEYKNPKDIFRSELFGRKSKLEYKFDSTLLIEANRIMDLLNLIEKKTCSTNTI